MILADTAPARRRIRVRKYDADIGPSGTDLLWHRAVPDGLELCHRLSPGDLCDDVVVKTLSDLVERGILRGRLEFEDAAVGLIESTGDSVEASWDAFYDNTLRTLSDGTAAFAPVHRRARALVRGDSVLEVGSCFGFLSLTLAARHRRVEACDISPGAVRLLERAARRLGLAVAGRVGDAVALPYRDAAFDTVAMIHLLEHLEPAAVDKALGEALRVARKRVIVAVPFEERPSTHFGHRTALTAETLRLWAARSGHPEADQFADHGGWLILDPRTSAPTVRSRRAANSSALDSQAPRR